MQQVDNFLRGQGGQFLIVTDCHIERKREQSAVRHLDSYRASVDALSLEAESK